MDRSENQQKPEEGASPDSSVETNSDTAKPSDDSPAAAGQEPKVEPPKQPSAAESAKPEATPAQVRYESPIYAPTQEDEELPWNSIDAWGSFGGSQVSIASTLVVDGFLAASGGSDDAAKVTGAATEVGVYLGFSPAIGVSAGLLQPEQPLVSIGLHLFRGNGWVVFDAGEPDLQVGVAYPTVAFGGVVQVPAGWVRLTLPGFRLTLADVLAVNLRPVGATLWFSERVAVSYSSQLDLGVMF